MGTESLNRSFSTRVLLLSLFLGCFQPSSSADRWRNPCAGVGETVGRIAVKTVASSAGEAIVADMAEQTSTIDMAKATVDLLRRSNGLKRMVNSLKNDYVRERFRDASTAEEERKHAGSNLPGYFPSWTRSSGKMSETLQVCYENVARLAVLTRITREGEEKAVKNRKYFSARFRTIEDNAESGLYAILCHLYVVMTNLGIEVMSPKTEAEVASIKLPDASSNFVQHIRDYIVLHALDESADKLIASFARLAGQVDTETTTSTAQ